LKSRVVTDEEQGVHTAFTLTFYSEETMEVTELLQNGTSKVLLLLASSFFTFFFSSFFFCYSLSCRI
jgi:hypothetical protein